MAARRLTELTSFQDLHDRVGEEGDLRDFLYDTNLRVGIITQAEFEHYLRLGGNFWQYEGEPRPEQAHALFTNGGHVGHFINLGGALKQNDAFAKLMAHQLLGYAIQPYWQGPIDRVIGSDSSATRLAELVGQATGYSLPGRMVKVEEAGEKRQDWPEDQQPICPGEIVAHVEELVSTASTIWRIKDGVARAHPGVRIGWIPAVFTVVDQKVVAIE